MSPSAHSASFGYLEYGSTAIIDMLSISVFKRQNLTSVDVRF